MQMLRIELGKKSLYVIIKGMEQRLIGINASEECLEKGVKWKIEILMNG